MTVTEGTEVMYHSHKCPGCGAIWCHADDVSKASRSRHLKAHNCPKCSLEVRVKHRDMLTREAALRIDPQAVERSTRLWTKILAVCGIAVLTGCACVEPASVRVFGEHVSHASQHFGSDPTDYGFNMVAVEAHWESEGWFADLDEGLNLNSKSDGGHGYGALVGPREVFTARAGYDFQVK